MKHIVVFTGAGISAESGIPTFRDANGLWENHAIEDVATPAGWQKNKALVLTFYNERRAQLDKVKPNDAHRLLAAMEKEAKVSILTQNVDNLHEQAGSTSVLHLHGELTKARSTLDEHLVYEIGTKPISVGDVCEKGAQLRPHIVWFGEDVPLMSEAIRLVRKADILLIIGTSLHVYPAASLVEYVSASTPIVLINPQITAIPYRSASMTMIEEKASIGLRQWWTNFKV